VKGCCVVGGIVLEQVVEPGRYKPWIRVLTKRNIRPAILGKFLKASPGSEPEDMAAPYRATFGGIMGSPPSQVWLAVEFRADYGRLRDRNRVVFRATPSWRRYGLLVLRVCVSINDNLPDSAAGLSLTASPSDHSDYKLLASLHCPVALEDGEVSKEVVASPT
jgi:hypothetical protein